MEKAGLMVAGNRYNGSVACARCEAGIVTLASSRPIVGNLRAGPMRYPRAVKSDRETYYLWVGWLRLWHQKDKRSRSFVVVSASWHPDFRRLVGRPPPWEGELDVKIPVVRDVAGDSPDPDEVGKLLAKLPHLRSFLFSPVYEDGSTAREGGKVWITASDRGIDITLKEPTACLQILTSVAKLEDLWPYVEGLLSDEKAPWTVDKWAADRRDEKNGKKGGGGRGKGR